MIIFDTSIWIDALKGKNTAEVQLLIKKTLNGEVVLTPIIIQEILQGKRFDDQFEKVKRNLTGFNILKSDPLKRAIESASLFRELRKKGFTIRKPNDCSIAYEAIKHNLPIVHNDSDFDLIAKGSDLSVLEV
ncbi:hypothetical protein SAMN06298216_0811 [Spirosomataceae bacterium TFI 002]|nr:hypothetical protein SAMN06298216_0811 [Spirosomataceae bacterium TFI 002]